MYPGYTVGKYEEDIVALTRNNIPLCAIEIKKVIHHELSCVSINDIVEMFLYTNYIMRMHDLQRLQCMLTDGYRWHSFVVVRRDLIQCQVEEYMNFNFNSIDMQATCQMGSVFKQLMQ